MGNSVHLQVRM